VTWDPLLFAGTARHYARGRLPYAAGMADAVRAELQPGPGARLLDVGCGPATVAIQLAGLFDEVVGVDPDEDMVREARRLVEQAGITNVFLVNAPAEDLPLGLGDFDLVTFASSFHWMHREQVAATVRRMLTPAGQVLHVDTEREPVPLPPGSPPTPPHDRIRDLVTSYLGEGKRAGSARDRIPVSGEDDVWRGAGFDGPRIVRVESGQVLDRSVDDLVASVLSMSFSAPHLFGDRLPAFVDDLRALLTREAGEGGGFAERVPDALLKFWAVST
jgi:SAM-dependent methyltransferase